MNEYIQLVYIKKEEYWYIIDIVDSCYHPQSFFMNYRDGRYEANIFISMGEAEELTGGIKHPGYNENTKWLDRVELLFNMDVKRKQLVQFEETVYK